MTEVQKTSVIHKDNQGIIFLLKNRQVGMSTKHIDICHHFMRDIVEDQDIDIKYIRIEENPVDIMMKNNSEADFVKHTKRITEGKLWNIMETGRENVKNTRVTDDVIKYNKTEYSSHTLTKVVYG